MLTLFRRFTEAASKYIHFCRAQATPAATLLPWLWAAVVGEVKRKLFPLWGRKRAARFRLRKVDYGHHIDLLILALLRLRGAS